MSRARIIAAVGLGWAWAGSLSGCAERGATVRDNLVREQVDKLVPAVESAVGLTFKQPPRVAVRTSAQVRAYFQSRMAELIPPAEIAGITQSYRLFGLVPDTLDLEALLVELYTEQVVGYYDPDSATLYAVEASDPIALRTVLAHELIHALQAQYAPVDSLLSANRDHADVAAAVQATLEGHAVLYSLMVMTSSEGLNALGEFWADVREVIRTQQEMMPVFSQAPLVLQESLIFPYLAGADFVRWFDARRQGTELAFTGRVPRSTEQILHPERFAERDDPIRLDWERHRLDERVTYENEMGELQIRILLAALAGSERVITTVPLGWGGDRFRVYDGEALVWYAVWDSRPHRDRALRQLRSTWRASAGRRRGYRTSLDPGDLDGASGLALVHAPIAWEGWADPPRVRRVD